MNIVLDTCALIWWSLDPDMLSPSAQNLCDVMEKNKNGLVASISLWEIALKVKKNKLDLGTDINTYINILDRSDVIKIISVDVGLWLDSVNLDWKHRDPADRVIVALANNYQAQLITKDTIIKDFYSLTLW
ncbi:type II toxin-antitoxin system VapC family toxin [Cyanobacterium aponinum FACHB-4101]|uniref:type II toxin-antitoxin system VapC family toxin n=1 Tax=Cyanobacterium aponinum TaxID=379064 RepID=UPI0016806A7E|nr:type II toxin-antitoxin system VapC family toxin [Cyanobacterium aponinum]MBD2392979.1 type II toxin-antitoxin system VapC family toxin [Cyanobacterium aponinum FACHB-4101]